jgi:cell division protein FtsB
MRSKPGESVILGNVLGKMQDTSMVSLQHKYFFLVWFLINIGHLIGYLFVPGTFTIWVICAGAEAWALYFLFVFREREFS